MRIHSLKIQTFRNLSDTSLSISPKFNLFYGENGSGKTSLLESIYYVLTGQSFRSAYNNRIIQQGAQNCTLFTELVDEEGIKPLGVSKSLRGEQQIRYMGEKLATRAELIAIAPAQILHHDSYQLLDAGPKYRRQYLDWGVFHVKHRFLEAWQSYQRIIKQRNAALKANQAQDLLTIWDAELQRLANEITEYRQDYLSKLLIPALSTILEQFLPGFDIQLTYHRGWDERIDYLEALHQRLPADRQVGYTQAGPHRADLRLRYKDLPVEDILSRGQQKMLVCALKLAQAKILLDEKGQSCIYLLDDLPSELDDARQRLVIAFLEQTNAQVFVTGIHKEQMLGTFEGVSPEMFHVKHGSVTMEPVLAL